MSGECLQARRASTTTQTSLSRSNGSIRLGWGEIPRTLVSQSDVILRSLLTSRVVSEKFSVNVALDWPHLGELTFTNALMQYAPLA